MSRGKDKPLRGVVLDTEVTFTVTELCHACKIEIDVVERMVVEGVLEPHGERVDDWRFSGNALLRAQRAVRLVRDLRVNWPGAALALDLLEQLERYERDFG